jgi:hypothetical protein
MKTHLSFTQHDENWQTLCRFFPEQWRQKAFELGACQRLRGIPSTDILLRMLLLHLGDGLSLKQTCNIARQAGWASISAVSLLNRLRGSSQWLQWFCQELVSHHPGHIDLSRPEWLDGRRVKSIDATVVSEPGSTGADWRVHYCLELFDLLCEQVVLTDTHHGETVRNFSFSAGDVVVADRIYCSQTAVTELANARVDWVIRYRHKSISLRAGPDNPSPFDLFEHLSKVTDHTPSQWTVWSGQAESIPLRLIALRKSPQAAEQARKKYLAKMSRRQAVVHEQTLQLQDYILLLSTMCDPAIEAHQILNLYRLRWQIEIAFKRLKSIMGLGHLPKYDPKSCQAWLHGKLFVALLVEIMVEEARLFSPWGYPLEPDVPKGTGIITVAGS